MSRRVTIISVFGHRNKGDAAIFRSLLSHVEQLIPGVEISAVVRHPETERGLYPEVRIEEQLLRSTARNRVIKLAEMLWFSLGCSVWLSCPSLGRALLPRRKHAALEAIAEADLVLSCGGGFLHDSFPGFVVHLFEIHAVQRLRKPLILTSQSIGPFRSGWARRLARSLLDRCDVILPRERISVEYLRNELRVGRPRIELIPDLAFAPDRRAEAARPAAPALPNGLDGGEPVIGVTVRRWNFPGRAGEASRLNATFQQTLAGVLDDLAAATGHRIVFFPQAITERFDASDDRMAARQVAEIMAHADRVHLIEENLPVARLREMIGRCHLFVGTRMHSNIFALSAGVPTLAISYLPKTRGIMDFVGLGDLVVEMTDAPERFRSAARRLVESQDEIRHLLEERMPTIRSAIATTLAEAIEHVAPATIPTDHASERSVP